MKRIIYDYTFMKSEYVGKNGFKDAEIEELYPKLERVKEELKAKKKGCSLEFVCLPYAFHNLELIKDKAKELSSKFDTLVIVGIGGSDLGIRAFYEALFLKSNLKLKFLGNTTDPTELKKFLDDIDISKAVFNFISRSGETIEVLSVFHFLKESLKKEQIIVTTGETGYLRDISKKEGYFIFDEAANVGDRFAVLSVIGLFPLKFLGLDVDEFLKGARDLSDLIDQTSVREDPMLIFAGILYLSYIMRKQNIELLMPYSSCLKSFGDWFRQLFAESLGKNGSGITPFNLVGPTDQHSFLQLINDGPNDKVVTFIKVEEFKEDYKISDFKTYKGKTFSEILTTEYLATEDSITKNGKPNGTLILPKINEYYLGQLFYFFEIACSYFGALLEINPFDQPGVEGNKILINDILSGKKLTEVKRYTI